MPEAILEISPEMLVGLMKSLKPGPAYRLETIENALPEDAELISIERAPQFGNLWLRLRSRHFSSERLPTPVLKRTLVE